MPEEPVEPAPAVDAADASAMASDTPEPVSQAAPGWRSEVTDKQLGEALLKANDEALAKHKTAE